MSIIKIYVYYFIIFYFKINLKMGAICCSSDESKAEKMKAEKVFSTRFEHIELAANQMTA